MTEHTHFPKRAERTLTLFIVAKLKLEGGSEGLCRVRNLSAGGLMLETRMPLSVADRVVVELRGSRLLRGMVVWTRDGRAGIAFDQPIQVEDLLGPGEPPASRLFKVRHPRGPRVLVDCPIEVQLDGGRVEARLIDISQGGARLALPLSTVRDERLILLIPGLPLKLAIVRWSGAEAGVAFAEPLKFDLLSEWLLVRAAGEYWAEEANELG